MTTTVILGHRPERAAAYVATVLTGAIFGFFYAWVCSTMWGLDNADPRVAIVAMQAMNDSVRNGVFFPAFFLTPLLLAGAALLLRRAGASRAAVLFAGAAAVYTVAGPVLTFAINVPMNEDLAAVIVPRDVAAAQAVWTDFSGRWQRWNAVRAGLSGVALALAAVGLGAMSGGPAANRATRMTPATLG